MKRKREKDERRRRCHKSLAGVWWALLSIVSFPHWPLTAFCPQARSPFLHRLAENKKSQCRTYLASSQMQNALGENHQLEINTEELFKKRSPIPAMPSQMCLSLASSQLELLANSLLQDGESKVKSIVLYLPQENANTGQLEFLPAVLYPCPSLERTFIAMEADSGVAPALPKTLTRLPGFSHASSLIPGYPMMESSEQGGVGMVEEVCCELPRSSPALSVPLVRGPQTVGVLWVRPTSAVSSWSESEKRQVSLAAQSLSLALSLDASKTELEQEREDFQLALEDQLHQVKNPLQALRTYGKLLSTRIAHSDDGKSTIPRLLALAEDLMVQSDRVVDLLMPMDTLLTHRNGTQNGASQSSLFLTPYEKSEDAQLVRWPRSQPSEEEEAETEENSSAHGTGVFQFRRSREGSNGTVAQPPFAATTSSSRQGSSSGKVLEFAQSSRRKRATRRPATIKKYRSNRNGAAPEDMGRPRMEIAFVQDVLDSVLTAFSVIAAERGIEWEVQGVDSELPGVRVHPKWLEEAVSNVVDNALKYVVLGPHENGEKPRVRISMAPNARHTPGVTIWIEDNGLGIPIEERESVFKRRYRASKTKDMVAGSGLGLDITKTLISRMGGEVSVVDNDAHHLPGAVFRIVLYRDPPPR